LQYVAFLELHLVRWTNVKSSTSVGGMRGSNTITAGDQVRDPSTFAPFADFPNLPTLQLNAWLEAVRVEPVSAMEWVWSPQWTVGPRTVDDSMWFVILSGSAEAWLGDPTNLRPLQAGDMLLIPQKIPHMIRSTSSAKPSVIAVHFYANLFGGINLLQLLGFPALLSDSPELQIIEISVKLTREFAIKAPGWKRSMKVDIYRILLNMVRALPNDFVQANGYHGHAGLKRIFPAVEWIDNNLSRSDIDVEQIAANVFLSPAHFRRIFHDVFEMSPVAFVRQRRVERAGALMRTTDLTLKEIADRCGFTDTTYFSKTFRKLMKKTPNAYRRESVI
jgi:AraC-like DNA-binding protein